MCESRPIYLPVGFFLEAFAAKGKALACKKIEIIALTAQPRGKLINRNNYLKKCKKK